jgi:hypothetical protein
VVTILVQKILSISGGSTVFRSTRRPEKSSMINALLSHVSVAIVGTKMAMCGRLSLELYEIN